MSDNIERMGTDTRSSGMSDVIDPGLGWLASKTTWTVENFSLGLEVDVSAIVPKGARWVMVGMWVANVGAGVYARAKNDPSISNTPAASTEWSTVIGGALTYQRVWLKLSADGKAQITVANAGTYIYVSFPLGWI